MRVVTNQAGRGFGTAQAMAINSQYGAFGFTQIDMQCGLLERTSARQLLAKTLEITFGNSNQFA